MKPPSPTTTVKENMYEKVIDWATGDDTGMSSNALCRFMMGLSAGSHGFSSPSDADDRGRCIRLLNLIPEWWDRLDEMEKLPSHEVMSFGKGGMEVNQNGWKEQIDLIKKERNL